MSTPKARAPHRSYRGMSAADRVSARRERLLDAALELYGTRGFAATGVREICRHSGLTDRYFYESFRDSGELFRAVYDRLATDLLTLVAKRVSEVPARPEAQVHAAIDGFVRALAADPRAARIMFSEAPAAGGEVELHVRASLRRFAALVAATAEPHLPADTQPRLLRMGALSLVGAIRGVIIEWQDGQLDVSTEEMVAYLSRLFLAAGAAAGLEPGARA